MDRRRTVKEIASGKGGEKLTMLTAYDASMAALLDSCGVDMLLVGDSLGMVVLGYDSTIPVSMDEMLHHAAAVSRATQHALVVGDMPFGSYQESPVQAVCNGVRFLKEAGCDAVKLEGGSEVREAVQALVRAGVPVMGHLGLTPQTAGQLGGFKVQGRDLETAKKILADARILEEAGVFAIVLECVPGSLARVVTEEIGVPTIGIGAGKHCDGQVLVSHDMFGLFERFTPAFVKKYLNLAPELRQAVEQFRREVASGAFPGPEHTFGNGAELTHLKDG